MPKAWPMPALRTHPQWRERAGVQVRLASAEKKRREAEADAWLLEVKARKAARP